MDETGSIFTDKDLEQLAEHGISQEEASSQIAYLRDGRNYLQLEGSGPNTESPNSYRLRVPLRACFSTSTSYLTQEQRAKKS